MEQSDNVILIKLCRCGRSPHRKGGRNCHLCNREAQKRYRGTLKGEIDFGRSLRDFKGSPANSADGFIYFIRQGERGLIKIGFSADPYKRLRGLQTGSPFQLFLLGFVPAKQALERLFHDRFAAFRHSGEWFEPAQEIYDLIDAVCRSDSSISGAQANTINR